MKTNMLKFIGGFVALLILGLGAFYLLQYYQYRKNPEQQALNEFEKLKKLYEEDTYGGSTPEETLQLFIEALKKGDIELASKYFVIDEQEKKRQKLMILNTIDIQKLIDDISKDLSISKKVYEGDKVIFRRVETISNGFVDVNGKKIAVPPGNYTQTTILIKNPNNVWKILAL